MDKYFINKEIGSGSFGKVFVVESKLTGIQYVAKQIDLSKLNKKQKAAAEKEIHVLGKLKHPNIVRYKEAYSDERNLHIVMELCELGDLHGLIQETRVKNERLVDSEVMEYFVQICLALEYIHKQRILHRDLKTKNIFLKKGNVIKLGDFGVAKVLENSFELARTCIGSPFYISPEMCENQPYDKKNDIWSLGCVLFELATLRYAFTAKNMKSLLEKITTGEHTSLPPNTNPKIRNLIKKMLNQNPKLRPTATEILLTPFVSEYRERLSCRNSRMVPCTERSRSGDDLRTKTSVQNNMRNRARAELPISKSSLNLYTNDVGITEPEAKYKTVKPKLKKPNFWKSFSDMKMEKFDNVERDKNMNKETSKVRKLPKVDSLYYNLIEENSKMGSEKGKKLPMIRNMFERKYRSFGNEEVEKGDSPEEEKEEIGENGTKEVVKEMEEEEDKKERKKWETSPKDKNELVSFLNEADMVNTFSDISETTIVFKEIERKDTIEDLLFTETTDLSHIAVLQPQKLNELLDIDTCADALLDKTFLISPKKDFGRPTFTAYDSLEQRRIYLEQTLGLTQFLKVYKFLEDRFTSCQKHSEYDVNFEVDKTCERFSLERKDVLLIWELVQDDASY